MALKRNPKTGQFQKSLSPKKQKDEKAIRKTHSGSEKAQSKAGGSSDSNADSGKSGQKRVSETKETEVRPQKGNNARGNKSTPRPSGLKSEKLKLPKKFKSDTYKSIAKKYTDASGKIRMRSFDGKFLSKEAQEAIIEAAKAFDRMGEPYTYESLLSIKSIQNKIIVFENTEPDRLFYWNVQNLLDVEEVYEKRKLGNIFEVTRDYKVITFDGELMQTHSREIATEQTFKFCRALGIIEKRIKERTNQNPYLTVAVYRTEDSVGNVIRVKIDFSDIQGQVPQEIIDQEIEAYGNPERIRTVKWKKQRKQKKSARLKKSPASGNLKSTGKPDTEKPEAARKGQKRKT